jgi:uncharacterized protein YggE
MRSSAVAAVVVAVAALAAGCSGDDGSTDAAVEGGLESGVAAVGAGVEPLAADGAAAASAGITVVGTGSARVAPDTAEWSFGVQTSGDTAAAALSANSDAMKGILAALRDAGLGGDDLRTEQVSVYPRTSDDGSSIVGYDASNTAHAVIRDLERAGAIVDAVVAAGANQVYGPTLTASDAEERYGAAVEAAFDDARSRAQAIADKAGLALGEPVAIVEGASGGGGESAYARELDVEAAADVPIEPGVQEVSATLTVTFAIA